MLAFVKKIVGWLEYWIIVEEKNFVIAEPSVVSIEWRLLVYGVRVRKDGENRKNKKNERKM